MTRAEKEQSGLRRLVDETIDAILLLGQPITKTWAVHAVRKHMQRPTGDSAWYWLECEALAVDALVAAAIRARRDIEAGAEAPEQIVMPGYERLQKFYSVMREGEQTLVPIDQLSELEVESKKAEFQRNIRGLSIHLDEFADYHRKRLAGGF